MSWIATLFLALFRGFWQSLFPAKTAADQRIDDLAKQDRDASNARDIHNEVMQESDAELNADISRYVRKTDKQ